jgi:hypothetical protein
MMESVIGEVIELHRFFEAWLSGSLQKTREAYARFDSVMAEDFVMIPPDSNVLPRDVIMDIFWEEHGSRSAPFRIEIRNPTVRQVAGSLYLVIYEEWQFDPGQSARISSALIEASQRGLRWLSVHESWVPGGAADRGL